MTALAAFPYLVKPDIVAIDVGLGTFQCSLEDVGSRGIDPNPTPHFDLAARTDSMFIHLLNITADRDARNIQPF